MKIIHTADVHLGSKFKSANANIGKDRRKDLFETFFTMIEKAKDEKYRYFIISGDLFEDELISRFDVKKTIEKMKWAKDTRFIVSNGNHDAYIENIIGKDLPENIYINTKNKKYCFEDDNICFWTKGIEKREIKKAFEESKIEIEKDQINILVFHGDIQKDSVYRQVNIKELEKKGFDYIALGHIHKKELFQKSAYPGSPEPLDFNENGKHGFVEIEINEKIDFRFVEFAKREYVRLEVDIDPSMSIEEIIKNLISKAGKFNMDMDLFRIILKGSFNTDIDMDSKKL